MSQSDYIQYKKDFTVLSIDASLNFPPVLNSQNYTDYKGFVLENSVIESVNSPKKIVYRTIQDSNNQIVFDMIKNKSKVENMGINLQNCPSFLMCNNTNKRVNRVPVSNVYYTPTPQPENWKQTKGANDINIGNLIKTDNSRWKSWSSQFPWAVRRALNKDPAKNSQYTSNFCKCITKNLNDNNVCDCKNIN
jgi:hypothetical protein